MITKFIRKLERSIHMRYILIVLIIFAMLPSQAFHEAVNVSPHEVLRIDGQESIIVNPVGSMDIKLKDIHLLDVVIIEISVGSDQIIEGLNMEISYTYKDYTMYSNLDDLREGQVYQQALELSEYDDLMNIEYYYAYDNYDYEGLYDDTLIGVKFDSLTEIELYISYSMTQYRISHGDLDNQAYSEMYTMLVPHSLTTPIPASTTAKITAYLIIPIMFMDFTGSQNDHFFLKMDYDVSKPFDIVRFSSIYEIYHCQANELCMDDFDVGNNYVIPIYIEITSPLAEVSLEFDFVLLTSDPNYTTVQYEYKFNKNGFLGSLVLVISSAAYRIVDLVGHRKLQQVEAYADSHVIEKENRDRSGIY